MLEAPQEQQQQQVHNNLNGQQPAAAMSRHVANADWCASVAGDPHYSRPFTFDDLRAASLLPGGSAGRHLSLFSLAGGVGVSAWKAAKAPPAPTPPSNKCQPSGVELSAGELLSAPRPPSSRHQPTAETLSRAFGGGQSTSSPPQPQPPPPQYRDIPGTVPHFGRQPAGAPPPTYDDVTNPNAPPPSYQSLFGALRDARRKASGSVLEASTRLLVVAASALGCTLLIGLTLLVPLAMIAVGLVYYNDCPADNIPLFLMLGGLVLALKNALQCLRQCRSAADDEEPAEFVASNDREAAPNSPPQNTRQLQNQNQRHRHRHRTDQRPAGKLRESFLDCVLVAWFFVGCVIVFKNYEPEYENFNNGKYCHKTLYSFAFWLIASAAGIATLIITATTVLMVFSVCEPTSYEHC